MTQSNVFELYNFSVFASLRKKQIWVYSIIYSGNQNPCKINHPNDYMN